MIEQSTERLGEWREIDKASGRFLDMIGAQHGLPRPTTNDDFYRFLIKSRIEMSIRVGTINDLIQVLSNTSGLPTSSFNVENGTNPLSIKVLDMPTALTPNKEQRNILITWIKSVLPAGVSLEEMSFREASESEIKLGLVIEQATAFATPVTMVELTNDEE